MKQQTNVYLKRGAELTGALVLGFFIGVIVFASYSLYLLSRSVGDVCIGVTDECSPNAVHFAHSMMWGIVLSLVGGAVCLYLLHGSRQERKVRE